jgi:NADH:ubiquinone oxidoreductase subunit 6 (subunit J)
MVMFLFVVMTIDVKAENSKATFSSDLGLSIFLTNILASVLYFFFWYGGGNAISNLKSQEKELFIIKNKIGGSLEKTFFKVYSECTSEEMETRFIFFDDSGIFGEYMFYKHNFIFIFSAVLLLFAMVVAIVICMVFSDKRNVNQDN